MIACIRCGRVLDYVVKSRWEEIARQSVLESLENAPQDDTKSIDERWCYAELEEVLAIAIRSLERSVSRYLDHLGITVAAHTIRNHVQVAARSWPASCAPSEERLLGDAEGIVRSLAALAKDDPG